MSLRVRLRRVQEVAAAPQHQGINYRADRHRNCAAFALALFALGLFLLLALGPQCLSELSFGIALAGRRILGSGRRARLFRTRRLPSLFDFRFRSRLGRRGWCCPRWRWGCGLGSTDDRLVGGNFALRRHNSCGRLRPNVHWTSALNRCLFYRSRSRLLFSAVPFGKIFWQSIWEFRCCFYFSRCHFPSTPFT